MAELKSCPFCGGEAELYEDYNGRYKCFFFYVKCNICGGQGKITGSKDEYDLHKHQLARDGWNMRFTEKADD